MLTRSKKESFELLKRDSIFQLGRWVSCWMFFIEILSVTKVGVDCTIPKPSYVISALQSKKTLYGHIHKGNRFENSPKKPPTINSSKIRLKSVFKNRQMVPNQNGHSLKKREFQTPKERFNPPTREMGSVMGVLHWNINRYKSKMGAVPYLNLAMWLVVKFANAYKICRFQPWKTTTVL